MANGTQVVTGYFYCERGRWLLVAARGIDDLFFYEKLQFSAFLHPKIRGI